MDTKKAKIEELNNLLKDAHRKLTEKIETITSMEETEVQFKESF